MLPPLFDNFFNALSFSWHSFIKSTALEVEWPEELTEAGRYEARFIGNDIDDELDVVENKRAGHFCKCTELPSSVKPRD